MNRVLEKDRDLIYRFIAHHEMGDYILLHPGKPLVDGVYNGTLEDLKNVVCSLMETSRLRDHGHFHKLPFFVRNLLEVIQEEDVKEIVELNVVDAGAKLMRLRNNFGDKRKMEVLHFDINELLRFFDSENSVKCTPHPKEMPFYTWNTRWDGRDFQRFLILGLAVGMTAIAAKVVDVWSPIDSESASMATKRTHVAPNSKFIP